MSWHYLVSSLCVFILWLILEFAFQGTSKLLETIGWWWIAASLLLVFFGGRWIKRKGSEKRNKLSEEERRKRLGDLIAKYGDQEIAERKRLKEERIAKEEALHTVEEENA